MGAKANICKGAKWNAKGGKGKPSFEMRGSSTCEEAKGHCKAIRWRADFNVIPEP